jgi:hypothetical protein
MHKAFFFVHVESNEKIKHRKRFIREEREGKEKKHEGYCRDAACCAHP